MARTRSQTKKDREDEKFVVRKSSATDPIAARKATSKKKKIKKIHFAEQSELDPQIQVTFNTQSGKRKVTFAKPEVSQSRPMEIDEPESPSAAMQVDSPDTALEGLAGRVTRDFDQQDWIVLTQNEHGRFIHNPPSVGTAVFRTIEHEDGPNVMIAEQYPAPIEKDEDRTIVLDDKVSAPPLHRPLENFQSFKSYGKTRIRAESPGGTDYFATEMLPLEIDEEKATLGLFRPLKGDKEIAKGMPFWGSTNPVPFFKPKLSKADKEACLDEATQCQVLDGSMNKHQEGDIDYDVVIEREGVKGRSKSQNKVMGISACNAVHEFADSHEGVMSKDMDMILKRSYQAPLGWNIKSNYRPEHCHLFAHSLKPGDPQTDDNLAAAPKWLNTKMMLLERWAKWLAFNCPDSEAHLSCEMALLHGDWRIAEHVSFSISTLDNGHSVKIDLDMDPWAKYPAFSPACHIGQTTMALNHIHRGTTASQHVVASSEPVTTFNELYTTVYQKDRETASHTPHSAAKEKKAQARFEASLPSRAETIAHLPKAMQREVRRLENFDKDEVLSSTSPGMFSQYQHVKSLAGKKHQKIPTGKELRRGQKMLSELHGHRKVNLHRPY